MAHALGDVGTEANDTLGFQSRATLSPSWHYPPVQSLNLMERAGGRRRR